ASIAGFDYSSAMKSKGGSWTFDELFKFLKSPGSYIPGTKMSFAGLSREQDRINLISYLRSNADSPAPIPAPAPKTAAPAAAPAATAGGTTPGAADKSNADATAKPATPAPTGPTPAAGANSAPKK